MAEKDNFRIFTDEVYNKPPGNFYPTKFKIYNHILEIWCVVLFHMNDYKETNNRGYRYILLMIDVLAKQTWCILLKTNYGQKITDHFPNFLTNSKRRPIEIESDRGRQF